MSYVDGQGAKAYAEALHGPDGAELLDPYFTGHIRKRCAGKEVIDIGCGAAPWAIYAARYGAAAVQGFDSSQQMLGQAEKALAVQADEIAERIDVSHGTVKDLPVDDESFPVAMSLNVGCALPSADEGERAEDGNLADHLSEMRRVLMPGGFGIVTAPVSLETVFTTYGDEDRKIAGFEEALEQAESADEVRRAVGGDENVLRATIIEEDGVFRVASPDELPVGRQVLRKIPGLVVPNFVHTEADYEATIADTGLEIVEMAKPTLSGEQAAEDLNLSGRYAFRNPFAIYLLQKLA